MLHITSPQTGSRVPITITAHPMQSLCVTIDLFSLMQSE